MSFQAYLDNIKAKTGKTPADFAKLAAKAGITKHGETVAWLKASFGLGHGHANAIAAVLLKSKSHGASDEQEKLAALFAGTKARWRQHCDRLLAKVKSFGPDVQVSVNETYVNLLKGKRKFGIVKPASADRMDVGIKCKGKATAGRLEAAGSWNAMVTHRVRVENEKEIDAELMAWLKEAYIAC